MNRIVATHQSQTRRRETSTDEMTFPPALPARTVDYRGKLEC